MLEFVIRLPEPPGPPPHPLVRLLGRAKEAFRTFALRRLGASPESIPLANLLQASPELGDALRDPDVLALLQDRDARLELAQLLRIAAAAPNRPPIH